MTAVTATVVGERIEIRGPYNDRLNEFYRTLPLGAKSARFDAANQCWVCDATPGAAYRIVSAGALMNGYAFRPCGELLRLSSMICRTQQTGKLEQPESPRFKMWGHQLEAYHFAKDMHAALLAIVMGGGKSMTAITLLMERRASRVLIMCPKSVLGVWRREFDRHCTVPHSLLVLDGSQDNKRKAAMAEKHLMLAGAANTMGIVAINYESMWRPAFKKWATAAGFDAIVADESHRLKGRTSKASKGAYDIGRNVPFKLALTGTPMPHSPLDLFGQFRFLDAGIFGTSYHRFRGQFAITGHFGADHIVGFKNQDELAARMKLLTYEVNAEDADLDLPEIQHHERLVKLGAQSRKAYNELEELMMTEVGDGVVTVANALVKFLRLQQITSGHIVDENDVLHVTGTEKQDLLAELIGDLPSDEPVVVFCRFKHDLEAVREVAEKLKRRHGEVSGRHKDLTPNAEMPDDVEVLGVQIASGGVGINLARAAYGFFYSVGFSLGEFEQAVARLHRPEQSRPVNIYHLIAAETIDQKIYAALRKKKNIVEAVLDYMRGDHD